MRKILISIFLTCSLMSSAKTWSMDELRTLKPKLIAEFGKEHVNNYWIRAVRIAWLESKFDDKAIGKSGDTGILQIRQIKVDEYNRLVGKEVYRLSDCKDAYNSFRIFMRIMQENKSLVEKWTLINWNGHSKADWNKPTDAYNKRYQESKEYIYV